MPKAMSGNGYPLGLEMPIDQQQQQQHQHNQSLTHHQHQQLKMDHNTYIHLAKLNDGEVEHQEDCGGHENGKKFQWQRMKWTDDMIRYLIVAVYAVEEDQENKEHSKRKSGSSFHKKGKWKNVSEFMIKKGFVISPQQCEDKFNDLNKRYKRVNDILGKGTACKVVANQRLLNSMDHIPPEQKEEVRKLLNSKHLFFQDMCAYHNSGVAGGCSSSGGGASSKYNNNNNNQQGPKLVNDESGENCDDDDDEETEDGSIRARKRGNDNGEDEGSSKRVKMDMGMGGSHSQPMQETLRNEVKSVVQDGTKTTWEQLQWMRKKLVEMEEVRMWCQYQTIYLEWQKMKWIKFCGEKERQMNRMWVENEKNKLENDKMVVLLKQKALKLSEVQHQLELSESCQQQQQEAHNKMSAESSHAHE